MATAAEIREGLDDYATRCNANARLRKMLRSWSRTCVFKALDSDLAFTIRIEAGQITTISDGEQPSDLTICATSEDLADMFWGDLNPAQKYVTGEIMVIGRADDVLRVDAMAALIWVDG
jgi:putative sterol carrier protein